MNIYKTLLLVVIIAVSTAACSATPTTRNFKDVWKDTTITSQVKWKMGRDKLVKAGNINVDTWRGVVTMIGRVTSEEEKAKAEEIARAQKNVKDVRNYLDVVDSAVAVKEEPVKEQASKDGAVAVDEGTEAEGQTLAAGEKRAASAKEASIVTSPKEMDEDELMENVKVADRKKDKDQKVKAKREDWVEHEIGKDLAATGDDENFADDDITKQAEQELKELKARKKYNKR